MDACLTSWYSSRNLRMENDMLIFLLGSEEGDPWHAEWGDTGASTEKANLLAEFHTS